MSLSLKKQKYSSPILLQTPLETFQSFLSGSVINFAAGEFKSVGQKVDDPVDFTYGDGLLDWDTSFGED